MTAELVNGVNMDISSILPGKLVTSTLSASKSSNAETRAKSQVLMRALCRQCRDEAARLKVVNEILALPKTGKTASAEHRATLFAMLADIETSDLVSVTIIDTLIPLISKESNEAASANLGSAIELHLVHILRVGLGLASGSDAALSKELSSSKISTRRMLSHAIGSAIWTVTDGRPYQFSADSEKLINTLTPAFETNLAAASANLPANPAGFVEGYVAISLALGPFKNLTGAAKLVDTALALQVVSPKPTFLLNDKAYGKLGEASDELWLLRSLEAIVRSWGQKLSTEPIR